MSNFNLGSSKSFGDGKNVAQGNIGANFWGYDILKFDGSLDDKQKLLKVVKNYVHILTGKDIPVAYSRKGTDESYTDGKRITISSEIIPESLDSTIGLGLHEASHIVKTNFKTLHDLVNKKILDTKYHKDVKLIKNLFNWVEDRRIDWWAINKSPGFVKYYEELYGRYFYSEKVTNILDEKHSNVEETVNNYKFYIINSLHSNVTMTELKGLKEISEILDMDNVSRWENTEETLAVAVQIYDVIMKYVDNKVQSEDEETNGNTEGSQSGPSIIISDDSDQKEDEGDNGKNSEGESGTGDSNDEDSENTKLGEELSKAIEEALKGQEAFLDGEPVDEEGEEIRVKIHGSIADLLDILSLPNVTIEPVDDIKNNGTVNQTFEVITVNKIDLKNIKSNIYCIFVSEPIVKNKEFIERGFSLGTMLGKKLKIRNDKKILRTVKLKKGKIDKRNLHSAGYGSENIFYSLKEDKYNDIAIHISVDVSGSMEGKKWESTLVAIIAICKASSMINGIRMQLSFRYCNYLKDNYKPVLINFYDSKVDHINKLKYLIHLRPDGGTPEGICFEALKKNIMKTLLNKDTLFINFSDGMPMMPNMKTETGIKITKKVINDFKKSGISILSYFLQENKINKYTEKIKEFFIEMYGTDAEFIDVNSLINLAKTINNKILKLGS